MNKDIINEKLNFISECVAKIHQHNKPEIEKAINHQIDEIKKQLFITDVVVPKGTLRCPECYGTNIAQNVNKTRAKCIHCANQWAT